jgi:hypothetical protein
MLSRRAGVFAKGAVAMDAGWSFFRRVREQQLFQHVPQGWIFMAGNRWPYLVDSAQRPALLARVTHINHWRPLWLALFAVLFAALVAEANRLSGPGFSGWVDLVLIVGIVGHLASLCYRGVMPYLQWLLLRPILAGAAAAASPPAPTPIGFWESVFAGSKDDARNFSAWWLVIATLICTPVGLIYTYDAVASGTNYLTAAFMIYLALQSGGALFLKLKARQPLEPHAS